MFLMHIIGNVKLPSRIGKCVNLHSVEPQGQAYPLLLEYFQRLWPTLNVIDEHSVGDGTNFWAAKVARVLPYIRKDGIRYGSTSNRRTQADCYAFIETQDGLVKRVPVEISTLLVVKIQDRPSHVCAIVRRMLSNGNIPRLPWDL
jgi:hypothetical protein